jgi:glucokinase
MATAIGIDLGGTNIKGVLINENGELIHQLEQATAHKPAAGQGKNCHWKALVSEMIEELTGLSDSAVDAIGLAAPGLPNESNSAIRVMPQRLEGLENFVWSEHLQRNDVWVLNDAHAALMAEAKFGVGKGIDNIVMLTLGTGVGGGILINGKLYQGNYQMAGHLGHMTLDVDREDIGITGMPGTLENAMGNASLITRSLGRFSSTQALVEAYLQGDVFGTYIWLNSVRKLALGLRSLCNLLSPDLIILGGGITRAGDALYKPLNDFMEVYEWKNAGKSTPIRQAHHSDISGAVGAAGFALTNTNKVIF